MTDFTGNKTYNRLTLIIEQQQLLIIVRTEVINFTMSGDPEISSPEDFITYNYIATFLVENLSDSSEGLNDREYSVEEVHSEDDGISKLTVMDPHRNMQ